MADRETIIKGLKKCRRCECDDCTEKGASKAPFDCPAYDDFVDSAIVLLKEQEAEWIGYPECLAYDGAYYDIHIVCSACKYVFNIIENCTEEFHYCPHCGAKMGT